VRLPQEFRVGASVRAWHGGGTLTVSSGQLVLEPGFGLHRLTGVGLVRHTAATVTMLKRRIPLGLANTSLVLVAQSETAVVHLTPWQRRRLRRALGASGFTVDEQAHWAYTGIDLVKPWP